MNAMKKTAKFLNKFNKCQSNLWKKVLALQLCFTLILSIAPINLSMALAAGEINFAPDHTPQPVIQVGPDGKIPEKNDKGGEKQAEVSGDPFAAFGQWGEGLSKNKENEKEEKKEEKSESKEEKATLEHICILLMPIQKQCKLLLIHIIKRLSLLKLQL